MSDGNGANLDTVREDIHNTKKEYKAAILKYIKKITKKGPEIEREALRCLEERDSFFRQNQSPEVAAEISYTLPRPAGAEFRQDIILENCLESFLEITRQKLAVGGDSFIGTFLEVGSYYSRTSGSTAPDFDFLFEIVPSEENLNIHRSAESDSVFTFGIRRPDNQIVSSQDTFIHFKQKLQDILENIFNNPRLSPDLSHGGFAAPEFSGIRINQPAVTVLLKWKEIHFSIDITPCYRIANEQVGYLLTPEDIRHRFGDCISENTYLCHLVPLRLTGSLIHEWFISTSHLETCIIRDSEQRVGTSSLQKSIALLKTVGRNIFGLMIQNRFDEYSSRNINKVRDFIEKAIKNYKDFSHIASDEEERLKIHDLRRAIGNLLSYGHIFLPHEHANTYSEILSNKPISFNSAALKYTVLNTYNELGQNDYIRWEGALANIREQRRSAVRHTFLSTRHHPYDVRLFTVAGHSTDNTTRLLRDAWIHLAAIQLDNARRVQAPE